MQQVEETKCILRVLPVWVTCIVYYVAFAQTNTYVVLQATQSDRHLRAGFEVPPGSFTIFPMLALTVWIPLYSAEKIKFRPKSGHFVWTRYLYKPVK